ncbi:hypothetical protein PUNSTDRAFT_139123 [Punctularia strigosozonata HHB-11173 SS5]|uniref:Uncharacterized protein n=1 Tax=Punctularia strigosozonata (strain HHB-11173) TaxID=741275 RepID=R7S0T4_PUNST|nr:uncharacterized protein PUNSTDRAFT_139123 [Punctularia strigosozonata HHB-11173 SS5]EIN03818.1 hypothetical protein PUNSTDRAFT_139123 [Punctularia strigosozonata HHB-11173 SS5]
MLPKLETAAAALTAAEVYEAFTAWLRSGTCGSMSHYVQGNVLRSKQRDASMRSESDSRLRGLSAHKLRNKNSYFSNFRNLGSAPSAPEDGAALNDTMTWKARDEQDIANMSHYLGAQRSDMPPPSPSPVMDTDGAPKFDTDFNSSAFTTARFVQQRVA